MSLRLSSATALFAAMTSGAAFATPMPSHVVVVMLENHDYSEFVGNSGAPFINNTLIPQGLVYANSHGVEHPSQPNYLDFFSGSNQGVNNNNATATNSYNFPAIYAGLQTAIANYQTQLNLGTPGYSSAGLAGLQTQAAHIAPYVPYGTLATGDAFPAPQNFNIPSGVPFTTPNLASSLAQVGKSFVEYSEGLIAAGAADANGNANPAVLNNTSDPLQVGYAHRHDPAADWISATPSGNQLPVTADQDFSHFPTTPAGFDSLPSVVLVVPNTINDGHDGTAQEGAINADTWLAQNMANYLQWAKLNNSLLIVTTDENDFSPGNRILTVMDGDPGLFEPGVSYADINHFDVLAALEGINAAACTGAACSASGLPVIADRFVVPEPSSLGLLAGVAGLFSIIRRRRTR
ncbi:MAG: alkaline phosphatase family protein [Rhodopila sp.]